jgi:hypothetical protein
MSRKRARKAGQPMRMPEQWKQALKRGVAAARPAMMPESWTRKWQAGIAAMQPMPMTPQWRHEWARGVLAAGPKSPIAQHAGRSWITGVRRYERTGQPLGEAVLGGVKEMFTAEGIADLAGVTGGIAVGAIAPSYLLKMLKVQPTTTTEAVAGIGVAVAGSAVLNLVGQYRMGRLFLYSAIGSLVARMLLERLVPGATEGVGAVKETVEEMVKSELEKALKEEGLGVITTEEVPLQGGVGLVTTEAAELSGPMDVEPF